MAEVTTFMIRPRRGLRLIKRDHPRPIDRYIDYFGGRSGGNEDAGQRGGTVFVELRWPMTAEGVAANA